MTTGVGLPSYTALATWAAAGMDADYPVENLGDLVRVSKPARAAAAGTMTITFTLPAAQQIRLVALIGHNIPAGTDVRVSLWSDTSNGAFGGSPGTNVYDSGAVDAWPSGGPITGFRSIRPFLLSAAASVRSGRIEVEAFADKLQIGAIELAGFWEWPGMPYGRGIGVLAPGGSTQRAGGSIRQGAGGRVRKVDGALDSITLALAATTGIDFQKITDLNQPFIWGEAFEDPTTWARKCMLARNIALPPFVGVLHNRDKFTFQLTEHRR